MLSNSTSRSRTDQETRRKAGARLSEDITRVSTGDHEAMERVYRSTCGRVYALLLQMLPDRATAEEVMQESYLAIWRRADRFVPGQASPMSWVLTIARNKAIDRLRSDRLTRRSAALDELVVEPADPEPTALMQLEASAQRDRLHWCLDQLENRQSEAIRTAFFTGLTYDELARRVGVPLGTMKTWIRRGLIRLKACLEL